MLKILLRKQLEEVFRSYFYDAKKNKARSKGKVITYFILFGLLMVVVLGGIFTFMSFALCGAMVSAGVEWLYFTLMGLLAVFLGCFGSVFNTYAGLYLAQDNDLLLSMPIPVSSIIISRLLGVYVMGVMYAGVIMLPAIIVYWIVVPQTVGRVIGCLLLLLLISIIVLMLSCALGWVVAKISLKLKNKSFLTVLISLVFIGAYYLVYFKAQSVIQDLVMHAGEYGEKIRGAAYPLYLFGSVGTGDVLAMGIVTAAVLLLFALLWRLISRSFLRIATATGAVARKTYKETATKKQSVFGALLVKEFRMFTSSSNYMLNCGLGILGALIAGGAFLFRGRECMELLNGVFGAGNGAAAVLLCAAMGAIASMNIMATPSLSLEGKNLWLMQSLPVTPGQVLLAKGSVQGILTGVSTLFCIVCVEIIAPITWLERLFIVLFPLALVLLCTLFDLFLGVKMPSFTWTNENTPIKQSGNVLLALFGGFLYAMVFVAGYFLTAQVLAWYVYMVLATVVTLALSAILYGWLKRKGCAAFSQLG